MVDSIFVGGAKNGDIFAESDAIDDSSDLNDDDDNDTNFMEYEDVEVMPTFQPARYVIYIISLIELIRKLRRHVKSSLYLQKFTKISPSSIRHISFVNLLYTNFWINIRKI